MRYPTMAGLSFLLLAALGLATGHGNTYSPRQYYGQIQKHPRENYSYRPYYYKPSPTYAGYRHHYAVYPPRSKYVYMYNPYKKYYWGRCYANTEGKPLYSMLKEEDRKARIEDIPEKAFPAPSDVPPVPESKDGAKMELPPDDLPGSPLPEKEKEKAENK